MRFSQTFARTIKALYLSCFVLFFNVSLAARSATTALNEPNEPEYLRKSTDTLPLNPMDYRIKKIVVDPGHGGHDPGCSGAHSKEKHLVLKIAQIFVGYMKVIHPDVEVVLTRNSDVFIPLHERARIANKADADLFISIHCNFMPGSSATKGSETFVLGQHRMEENLDVALRENASILLEENYEENYDYDPNSPEGHIVLSLYQNVFLGQSIRIAEKVEKYLHLEAERKSRGVKQAGFIVLKATAMPSVLVEAGFLSNKTEEEFLNSENGQELVSLALLMAFSEYKAELEGTPPASVDAVRKDRSPFTKDAAIASSEGMMDTMPAGPVFTSKQADVPEVAASAVQFRVQLLASAKPVDTSGASWSTLPYKVEIHKEANLLKYQAGGFASFEDALEAQRIIRAAGFSDAFVVFYRNGQRITHEAIRQFSEK